MKNFSDEDLIGYLLGALEPEEEKQIADALDDLNEGNLQLRERLAELEDKLTGLPDRFVEIDPPEGLAEKTLNTISIVDSSLSANPTHGPGSVESARQLGVKFTNFAQDPDHELGSDKRNWSVLDMIVGSAVCFVVAALLLPSIVNSRFQSNLLLCQDNLRQIGYNLASQSDSFDGRFVIPEDTDQWQASYFVTTMMEDNLAEPSILVCANDPGREEMAKIVRQAWQESISLVTPEDDFVNPTQPPSGDFMPEQVVSTDPVVACAVTQPKALLRQTEAATGSYGFPAPQLTSSGVATIEIPGSPTFVLCADAACFDNPGYRSRNHGNRGQNVLLGDLSVDYICETACLPTGDHIYTNSQGKVQPGIFPGDNLIYRGVLKKEYQIQRP